MKTATAKCVIGFLTLIYGERTGAQEHKPEEHEQQLDCLGRFLDAVAAGKQCGYSYNEIDNHEQAHQPEPEAEDAEDAADGLCDGAHKAPENGDKVDVEMAHILAKGSPFGDAAGELRQAMQKHHNAQPDAHDQQAEIAVITEL